MKDSVFEHWSSVLRLRKAHKDVFIYGDFELLDESHKDVFTYARTFKDQKVIVVANFRKTDVDWLVPKDVTLQEKNILISNYSDVKIRERTVSMRSFEAIAFSAS